ncbi:AMP-binding protein [Streptomyces bobili]|uniref:AMP-binding protein n=1 Tax=Streptomyces bobili TaxID=67280 RepID=UPI002253F2E5|nr:AMP-binding protein [Streptomyces bobili]MCX5522295.1 AMP-binding protein [Streptomyces bobili]
MVPRLGSEAQAALRLMLDHDVTFFAGAPTMYWGLLAALDETVDVARLAGNLRVAVAVAVAGGAALPAEIHKQFKDRFGVTILEGYGLSETSPIASRLLTPAAAPSAAPPGAQNQPSVRRSPAAAMPPIPPPSPSTPAAQAKAAATGMSALRLLTWSLRVAASTPVYRGLHESKGRAWRPRS